MIGCSSSRHITDETAYPLDALLSSPLLPAGVAEKAPILDTEELARRIQTLVNDVRVSHGIKPLVWEQRLANIALDHSRDMADHPFFGHTNPRGQKPEDRARQAGLPAQAQHGPYLIEGIGENLFLTHRYREYRMYRYTDGSEQFIFDWKSTDELVREAIDLWMQSSTHRANLLSPLYKAAGVGIVHTAQETLFITQNFSYHHAATLASR